MYITVQQLANKINNLERFEPEELKPETDTQYRQYIADLYHCSDCWGQKVTEDEMRTNLEEWNKETDPEEYVPAPYLFRQCAAYWNELCDAYPN